MWPRSCFNNKAVTKKLNMKNAFTIEHYATKSDQLFIPSFKILILRDWSGCGKFSQCRRECKELPTANVDNIDRNQNTIL